MSMSMHSARKHPNFDGSMMSGRGSNINGQGGANTLNTRVRANNLFDMGSMGSAIGGSGPSFR